MTRSFSERHGYQSADRPIVVREDAPEELRGLLPQFARSSGFTRKALRALVCRVLLVAPQERYNWSDSNIMEETRDLLADCDWFKVYDVAEEIWRSLETPNGDDEERYQFANDLNRLFRERGIGWELKEEEGIVFRGDETFTATTRLAMVAVEIAGLAAAKNEIHEALADISRRPVADRTGAVQHAMAALECVAREIAGDPNATLGKLVDKIKLPKPLDVAMDKMWGYASDRARHVREGGMVEFEEAALMVSVSCAICSYLLERNEKVS